MNVNLIPTTAKQGGLACGRALGMHPGVRTAQVLLAAPTGRVTGQDSVFVHAYPGTPVWRPPSC